MKQLRQSFFTPGTGKLFLQGNKPNETAFRNLMDSVPFFNEVGDTGSETQQGLVKMALNASVMTRTSAASSSMSTVVRPHQIPSIVIGSTEILTGTASAGGIKLVVDNTGIRSKYALSFDPSQLNTKSSIVAGDSVVISDSADSGNAKKVLISVIQAGLGGLWSRSGTVLSPQTTDDDLDIKNGSVTGKNFYLTPFANNHIRPLPFADNRGSHLFLAGGSPSSVSGATLDGGNLYLYGGSSINAGVPGALLLAFNGTSAVGKVGIGGNVDDTAFGALVRINASSALNITGQVKLGISSVATVTHVLGLDANNVMQKQTAGQIINDGLGIAGNVALLPWYNGSGWSRLTLTAGKYLHVKTDGTLESSDLDLTGKIDNSSFSGDGTIALARLASEVYTKADMDIILDSIGSLITGISRNVESYSKLSPGTNTLVSADLKASHTLDCTGGSNTTNLPLISTLYDGQTVEFNQWGANTGRIAANGADEIVDSTGAGGHAFVDMSGAEGYCKLRCDHASHSWTVIGWK